MQVSVQSKGVLVKNEEKTKIAYPLMYKKKAAVTAAFLKVAILSVIFHVLDFKSDILSQFF